MSRVTISTPLARKLMYESQYVCVVCQSDSCQIHHVDKNNANSTEDNLVVLCHRHHDEAHTVRELSRNLDAGALKDAKLRWLAIVHARREAAATVSGQRAALPRNSIFSIGLNWGYINHSRVVQLAQSLALNEQTQALLNFCASRSIVDQNGVILKPANIVSAGSSVGNTVYDWFPHGDDQRLHMLYGSLVDQISVAGKVVHMEPESWNAAAAKDLLSSGAMIFTRRTFSFKKVSATAENEHRRCRTKQKNLTLEFFVDTKDMFGTTSITVSFAGKQTCAALVLVKSLNELEEGGLEITGTPIALGVCFQPAQEVKGLSRLPHI